MFRNSVVLMIFSISLFVLIEKQQAESKPIIIKYFPYDAREYSPPPPPAPRPTPSPQQHKPRPQPMPQPFNPILELIRQKIRFLSALADALMNGGNVMFSFNAQADVNSNARPTMATAPTRPPPTRPTTESLATFVPESETSSAEYPKPTTGHHHTTSFASVATDASDPHTTSHSEDTTNLV